MKAEIKEEKTFQKQIAPKGNHPARIVGVQHIGMQANRQGELQDMVRVTFELVGQYKEWDKDGEHFKFPWTIGKQKVLSMYNGAFFRKLCDVVLNTGTLTQEQANIADKRQLLGQPVLVNVNHFKNEEGEDIAYVDGTPTPVPTGLTVPEAETELTYFSFDESDMAEYKKLTSFMQDTIAKSQQFPNWAAKHDGNEDQTEQKVAQSVQDDMSDPDVVPKGDIPF